MVFYLSSTDIGYNLFIVFMSGLRCLRQKEKDNEHETLGDRLIMIHTKAQL